MMAQTTIRTPNETLHLLKDAALEKLHRFRVQLLMVWALLSALWISLAPTYAQSIELDPEDLDVFFDWFNTMFSVILPIALIGAGLVAGALFAFAVGTMLKKAFQSLAGGV